MNMVNSPITKFNITPLQNPNNNIVAVATVTFHNALSVNSITIRKAQNGGLYVKMPQKLTKQGNYIDVIHPLNSESRKAINAILIDAYCTGTLRKEYSVSDIPNMSAQNSVKYEVGKYGNNLARLDVIVNDMVVHNCKIINSKDNKPLLTLPTYKDKNGVYHSIMTPTNPEMFKLMNQAALKEYNTEYSFKKCDESQLSAIKEAGIKCSSNKNAQGDIFVKFKTSNLSKVNNILSQTATMHK